MPYVGFADILTWNHQFWKWIPTVCMNICNAWSVMFKAGQYWDHLDQFYTCKVLAKTIWNQVSYKSLIPFGLVIFSLSEKNVHLNVISRQLFYSKLYFHYIFFFKFLGFGSFIDYTLYEKFVSEMEYLGFEKLNQVL